MRFLRKLHHRQRSRDPAPPARERRSRPPGPAPPPPLAVLGEELRAGAVGLDATPRRVEGDGPLLRAARPRRAGPDRSPARSRAVARPRTAGRLAPGRTSCSPSTGTPARAPRSPSASRGTRVWAHPRGRAAIARRVQPTDVFAVGDELPGGLVAFAARPRSEVVLWDPRRTAPCSPATHCSVPPTAAVDARAAARRAPPCAPARAGGCRSRAASRTCGRRWRRCSTCRSS